MAPDASITDEKVAAWRATLDEADKVLDGELLMPHWRFKQGFDLKAYFETATRTDLVMLLTGYGALPFLKDGPIAGGRFPRPARQRSATTARLCLLVQLTVWSGARPRAA